MLTKIEIDGFKTFEAFRLDLMPLCVVTGPNAVGKSNLFDAIRLLSRMVSLPDLGQAFAELRGRPSEQFRSLPSGDRSERISFAVECLLDGQVEDNFGNKFNVKHSRVRYELSVERRLDASTGIERLFIHREAAKVIRKSDDGWASEFIPRYRELACFIKYGQRRNHLLDTTTNEAGITVIEAYQDGVQGRPRPLPAERATATYLSTVNDAKDFGHLYALRRTLSDIVFLQADPLAARSPSFHNAPEELQPSAGNLAAVLYRIKATTKSADRPLGALSDIAVDLSSLVPGVMAIDTISNEEAKQFEVSATLRNGQKFSSRILSDGTLRALALVTVANDPRRPGILCFEEPENGISESRVGPLISLLRDACADPGSRLFQVLMNSHSPRVLAALADHEVVVADLASVVGPEGTITRRTRMRTRVAAQLFPDDRETQLSDLEAKELLEQADPEAA